MVKLMQQRSTLRRPVTRLHKTTTTTTHVKNIKDQRLFIGNSCTTSLTRHGLPRESQCCNNPPSSKRLAKNYTQSTRLHIAKSCNLPLCNIYETPNKLLILMGRQFEGLL